MRRHLPASSLLCAALISGFCANAQEKIYAITDIVKDGANWSYLRTMDMGTGQFSDVVLNGSDPSALSYDAETKKQMTVAYQDARVGGLANAPFAGGVAALSMDAKNNRLYYTPMLVDQLRYIDLKTMQVYFVNIPAFAGEQVKAADQSNILTRMAIASDGHGYALSNDAQHLVKFTTGKKMTVTHMGGLVDDAANKGVSVHNSCTSYGGDMIADDEGNLYIFSARNHVFKVNIETKVATHLGAIKGLPANYTVNGAAVTSGNQIWISSATNHSAIYSLDHQTLEATMLPSADNWRTADMASAYLLSTRKPSAPIDLIKNAEEIGDGRVALYPNPVLNREFKLQLSLPEGDYTVQVTDVVGRKAVQTTLGVKAKGQTETVVMPGSSRPGMYLVQIVDPQSKTVFSKKIMLQ